MLFVPADYRLYSKTHGGWISALHLARCVEDGLECWNGRKYVPVSFTEMETSPGQVIAYSLDSVTKIGLLEEDTATAAEEVDFDFHWRPPKMNHDTTTSGSGKQVVQAVLDFCLHKIKENKSFHCKVPRARAEAVAPLLPVGCEVHPVGKRYCTISIPSHYVCKAFVEKQGNCKRYLQAAMKLAGKCIRPGIYLVTGKNASGFRRLRRKVFSSREYQRNSMKVFTATKSKQFSKHMRTS